MTASFKRMLGAKAVFPALASLSVIGLGGARSDNAYPSSSASEVPQMAPSTIRLPIEGQIPSLAGATAWINSPALTPADLRGKVVVIDVWTYTCINWLRTLPYVRAWAAKYKDRGLVVVGVHAPEFPVERDLDNVRRAVKEMRIDYPVAVDNDYAIWRALNNEYWPALYVVDAKGRIRHHYFGEGEYQKTERVIQRLLTEAGVGGVGSDLARVDARGAEAAADWSDSKSPENYVGSERTRNFASPGAPAFGESRVYALPTALKPNHWALAGNWTIGERSAVANGPSGRIAYRFHSRDLHLVMGPSRRGTPVRFRVRIDGQPPGNAHGSDLDADGNGTVTWPRLYQLIRQPKPIVERQLEIEFLDPGVELFAFTFG